MNSEGKNRRKDYLTLKSTPEFFTALQEMATAAGLLTPAAVDRFTSELLEVAIIECYEKRFGRTISGTLTPVDVVEPEPETEDEEI